MAKKTTTKKTTTKKAKNKNTEWGENFKLVSDKINEAKRANRYVEEVRIPKMPKATLFIDGKKIILNA